MAIQKSETVITKGDRKKVFTKLSQSVTEVYYKVRQVLQSVTNCYYKVRYNNFIIYADIEAILKTVLIANLTINTNLKLNLTFYNYVNKVTNIIKNLKQKDTKPTKKRRFAFKLLCS